MPKPIIYGIESTQAFRSLIEANQGLLIVKFGADWCGPCKRIDPQVKQSFRLMPDNVQCIVVDVDESLEVYGFLKTKKMMNGIPAILAYKSENNTYIPDEFVVGADPVQVDHFFKTCFMYATENMKPADTVNTNENA